MDNPEEEIVKQIERGLVIYPYINCDQCGDAIELKKDHFWSFYGKNSIACNNCKRKLGLSLWNIILNQLKTKNPFVIFSAIGAAHIVFRTTLKPGEMKSVNLEDYGLPKGGRILFINYTPHGGGLIPCEIMFGNSPSRSVIPRIVKMYSFPVQGKKPEDTTLSILVIWVPIDDDESWKHLVNAFEYFSDKNYKSMIVPAHIAVETRITKVLQKILIKTSSKENVENCITQSFSNNLNVILPAILKPRNVSMIDDDIRGKLNRLRDLRNDMVHEGRLKCDLNDNDAAELICSAIFGFYYSQYIDEIVFTNKNI